MSRLVWRALCTGVVAAALAVPAWAQQAVLKDKSRIEFVSRQMGVPVEGRFQQFDAQLAFDPAKPEAAKIVLHVETGSATLGVKETDAELRKPDWFGVEKFPRATFTSSSVKALGGGKFEVTGQLAIKGQTQPVSAPVTLSQSGELTTATGQFSIKRLAFGIGAGEWSDTSMVADEVQVRFSLTLTGVGKL